MVDLIPRSVLFGNPERTSPQISPDGSTLAWIAPRFFAVAAAGLAVNSVCMFALVNYLHLPYLLAQCAATVCVLATTYVANSIWAFKTHTA